MGLSLRELARRIDMAPSHLSRIERDKSQEITTGTLRKLCFVLGVSADWLIGSFEPQDETDPERVPALANRDKIRVTKSGV